MDFLSFDTLCKQATDYARSSLDISCAGLQRHLGVDLAMARKLQRHLLHNGIIKGMESRIDPWRIAFRMPEPEQTDAQAWLELLTLSGPASDPVVFTAAQLPLEAARFMHALDESLIIVPAPTRSLKNIVSTADKTWWSTGTGEGYNAAEIATMQACNDLKRQGCRLTSADGLVIFLELSGDCQLVDSLKATLDHVKTLVQHKTDIAPIVTELTGSSESARISLLVTKSGWNSIDY